MNLSFKKKRYTYTGFSIGTFDCQKCLGIISRIYHDWYLTLICCIPDLREISGNYWVFVSTENGHVYASNGNFDGVNELKWCKSGAIMGTFHAVEWNGSGKGMQHHMYHIYIIIIHRCLFFMNCTHIYIYINIYTIFV